MVPEMKCISKLNWMVALTAVAIFSFFATGNAYAWGPLAQSSIAQAAQNADGMPPATDNRNFVMETTMPKVFEYTGQSYATVSYDYTDIMGDNLHGINDFCQMLAWGSAQTAEKTGDNLFFHQISQTSYDRWINELLSDALLFCIESPYHGTARAEVAVSPKLVSDTTTLYTAIYGGEYIGGRDTILAAYNQALVLVGELAIIDSPVFQQNARTMLDTSDWVIAMDKSVVNVVEYAVNSTQAQSSGNWVVGEGSEYGSRLLSKLGALLVATADAQIAPRNNMGIYSYRVCLNSARVNEITMTYLYSLARNLHEHPIIRQLARSLYDLMDEDTFGSGYVGPVPPGEFGARTFSE